MKFADLQAKRTTRDRHECYVNEMPVISTVHLPKSERDVILDWGENAPLVTAYRIDGWNLIIRVTDLDDDALWPFATANLQVLPQLMTMCAERGFTHIHLSPDGYEFPDLPEYGD